MDQPKETLVRRLSARDSGLINRDSINITLDTFAHLFNGAGEWRWGTKIFFYPHRLVGQLKKEPASDDKSFSISWASLQLKYRREIKPLSDLFLVYTRLVDSTGPIRSFKNIFTDGYQYSFKNLFVVKLRYCFASSRTANR